MKKKRPKYTVDWFIEFFSSIPAKKWCVGALGPTSTGRCCAIGHIYQKLGRREGRVAIKAAEEHLGQFLSLVNDGFISPQGRIGPRGRILKAFKAKKR